MDNYLTKKVSAIFTSEDEMETAIHKLMQKTVSQHDVSVQNAPGNVSREFGNKSTSPDLIQKNPTSPKKEPFLKDDFGWVLGYSFSIPFVIGIIIGVFVIGDIRSQSDNWLFGIIGGLLGGLIGLTCATIIKRHRENGFKKQESEGGFVIWITITSEEKLQQVISILKTYHAKNIIVEE